MVFNFVTTRIENLLHAAQANSLDLLSIGFSCCPGSEIEAGLMRESFELEGIKFRESPRQSDVLIVNGAITQKMAQILKHIYNQMSDPKWVIAIGNCAVNGGCFKKSEAIIGGCSKIIPVDVTVLGCPPSRNDLLKAIFKIKQIAGEPPGV